VESIEWIVVLKSHCCGCCHVAFDRTKEFDDVIAEIFFKNKEPFPFCLVKGSRRVAFKIGIRII
jgi:hypothetical protein